MKCKNCGEDMIGDGHTAALHCPDTDASDREPDADPLHCDALGDDVKLPPPDVLHEVSDAPCPACGTMLRARPPIKLGYTAATVRRLIAEAVERERKVFAKTCAWQFKMLTGASGEANTIHSRSKE